MSQIINSPGHIDPLEHGGIRLFVPVFHQAVILTQIIQDDIRTLLHIVQLATGNVIYHAGFELLIDISQCPDGIIDI